jgi:hypothetical protein
MIYPVNIQKWFADPKSPFHEDYELIKRKLPELTCKVCGNKITIRSGYISHGFAYGYRDDNYCSYRCLKHSENI